jgi:hypothetical protein
MHKTGAGATEIVNGDGSGGKAHLHTAVPPLKTGTLVIDINNNTINGEGYNRGRCFRRKLARGFKPQGYGIESGSARPHGPAYPPQFHPFVRVFEPAILYLDIEAATTYSVILGDMDRPLGSLAHGGEKSKHSKKANNKKFV